MTPAAGADVTVVGRTARGVVEALEDARAGGRYAFVAADLFLLANAKRCVDALLVEPRPLDLLVQTQGMATIQGFTPSTEGLDQKLCLHVYSRALLASALAPALARSPDPRVRSLA